MDHGKREKKLVFFWKEKINIFVHIVKLKEQSSSTRKERKGSN